ncbi:hypothetical protein [Massilia sp. GCM10023247]|uniref:hypothetical protein n=1 Tax=Massilia sp. GCM10023247 TaxID=3252643 RepID=UPI00361AF0C5
MHWSDWPIVCLALFSIPLCLLGRRWIEAFWTACFAAFLVFDRILPTAVPEQLKRSIFVIGFIAVVYQVMKEYRKYKESLADG